MWTLSAFADEIAPELEMQLDTLERERIQQLDLRGVWGKNVLALSDDEVRRVAAVLTERGVRVATIGSPIGKIGIGDKFAPHLESFHRALAIAQELGAPAIRIFSFYIPDGDDPNRHRPEVLRRLEALVRAANGSGVQLLHENEKGIYGDTPARCHDLLSAIAHPSLGAIWDPANFVQVGIRPYTDGYDLLRPHIAAVHIKDAIAATGVVVLPGEGDGELRPTLAALHASGFEGVFTLEPHLQTAGPFAGTSGPELFSQASAAFKRLLAEQGIAWA
jgi:sugar phosphate isomerase/epimerase